MTSDTHNWEILDPPMIDDRFAPDMIEHAGALLEIFGFHVVGAARREASAEQKQVQLVSAGRLLGGRLTMTLEFDGRKAL